MSRRRVSTHAPSNYKRRMPPRGSRVSGGNRHDIGGYSAGKKQGGTRGDTRLVYQMENPWNRVCHVACAKKEKKKKKKKKANCFFEDESFGDTCRVERLLP